MAMFELITQTVALSFAAGIIVLLLLILTEITSVAESPKAWTFLTIGLSLLVVNFSIEVFIWTNAVFDFFAVRVIAAFASAAGFLMLLFGVYDVWQVIGE